jgi:hypothetical protein
MDKIYAIPNLTIDTPGRIGRKFSSLNINSLHDACLWVKDLPYGYNSSSDDSIILFDENKGNCSTKHGVIAELAGELEIPLYKFICFYKMDEGIIEGIGDILSQYKLKFIPQTHCLLGMNSLFLDLTAGNCHGKKKDIIDFDLYFKVPPNPDKELKEKILYLGFQFYGSNDSKFQNYSFQEYLQILQKCDEFHRNLCSIGI